MHHITTMTALQKELLNLICTTCNLQDINRDAMQPDSPLIGPESPLGTDSLDALEIAVTIQKEYGVRMDSENTSRDVLQSLESLEHYIRRHANNEA